MDKCPDVPQGPGTDFRVKLPNSELKCYGFLGVILVSWVAPGAPGKTFTEKWQKSAINISPGLLTDASRMVILEMRVEKEN